MPHCRLPHTRPASSSSSTKQIASPVICFSPSLRASSLPLLFVSFFLLVYAFGLALSPPFLDYHAFFFHGFSTSHILQPPTGSGTDRRKKCEVNFSQVNGSDTGSSEKGLQNGGLCNYGEGTWVFDPSRMPLYSGNCPFQRNSWNCERNKRPGLDKLFQWKWVPKQCNLSVINPYSFLAATRNMKIGFIGDSLNENFLVSFLCILRTADKGAHGWKKKRSWRGAYFPKFNVTVGYHRAVLLAESYELQPTRTEGHGKQRGLRKGVRVNVDVPASDWISVTDFYDIFVFNTGHWWGPDKFPPENPLVFYKEGEPLIPQMGLRDGLEVVLQNMIPYIERTIPSKALKIWRMQSPRHFEGGEWNQNGSCLSEKLLTDGQVEEWFGLGKGGVNKEAREMNLIIKQALQRRSFYVLDITHMSEYRVDAHPALWLGKKDAHIIWGQDCMHWCLPGLPDIWVDILAAVILEYIDLQSNC
eukprot:c24845_g1_i1 orf=89-1504(+)